MVFLFDLSEPLVEAFTRGKALGVSFDFRKAHAGNDSVARVLLA
jgi:hypothetical protein